ncbi:hypothetical protein BaRGS_00014964 [Batillaria attramentaria]|uniref:Uncharacterized protein n=1 Tax=Batillaria attramentaria TaxID=370345 RepID=A0ABD0L2R2_9CAEN
MFVLLTRVLLLTTFLLALPPSAADKQENPLPQRTSYATNRDDFQLEFMRKLLANKSAAIPPYTFNLDNSFNPVNVSISTFVFHIAGLDMRQQQLTFTVWFLVTYTDRSLSWDLNLYPVDAVFVNQDEIWIPRIFVFNSVVAMDQLIKQNLQVVVNSDGNVVWTPGDTITITCSVDIRLFPFDTQSCSIIIGPLGYATHQVNCVDARLDAIDKTAEWDVVDKSSSVVTYNSGNSTVWYIDNKMTLRRKWLFYALNVLLPVLLVSGLNSVVFALPVQCGEKMSVSLTTFLTLAVFMTLIQDSLPSNSDTVCYLVVYLVGQMVLSVVAVVVSAARVACHHHHVDVGNNCKSIHSSEGMKVHVTKTQISEVILIS